MTYKRRRDRWRKRPQSGAKRRAESPRHPGPFMGVPRVSGSAGMGVSSSGKLEERDPPSIWLRLGLLPIGLAATALFVVFIMTEFWFLLWAGLSVAMMGLIIETWRG